MSVIVAVVSGRDGIVASDGRRFASAQIGQPATVESDTFDKTFELDGGSIIGAFCGLVEFSGRTIAGHIREIVGPTPASGTKLAAILDQIAKEMQNRLNQIDEGEVALTERAVDLLIVGGEHLTRSELRIFSARFSPQGSAVVSETKSWIKYCRAREESASVAAGAYLDANYVGNRGAAYLGKIAMGAIEAAVSATGLQRYSSVPACGGDTFTKRTFYS
jgi:hypothetical protein